MFTIVLVEREREDGKDAEQVIMPGSCKVLNI